MRSFSEYLGIYEAKAFARSRDDDYTSGIDSVLIFGENEGKNYKKTDDKTHDAQSHAVKHYIEFEEAEVMALLRKFKGEIQSFLKSNKGQYCRIYKKGLGASSSEGLKALSKATPDTLLNTLDMINDKQKTKKTLLPIEKLALPYLQKMGTAYLKLSRQKYSEAVDLEKIESKEDVAKAIDKEPIVKFFGTQGGISREYVLDFRDNSILISSPDFLRTMFVFRNDTKNRSGIIKNFFNNRLRADTLKVQSALKDYIS